MSQQTRLCVPVIRSRAFHAQGAATRKQNAWSDAPKKAPKAARRHLASFPGGASLHGRDAVPELRRTHNPQFRSPALPVLGVAYPQLPQLPALLQLRRVARTRVERAAEVTAPSRIQENDEVGQRKPAAPPPVPRARRHAAPATSPRGARYPAGLPPQLPFRNRESLPEADYPRIPKCAPAAGPKACAPQVNRARKHPPIGDSGKAKPVSPPRVSVCRTD